MRTHPARALLALALCVAPAAAQDSPADVGAAAEQLAAERWLSQPPLVLTELLSADLAAVFVDPEQVELAKRAKPVEVGEHTELEKLGPNKYRIKLALADAGFEQQRDDEWCWAACARMVNEFNRLRDPSIPSPSQETLARYFKGGAESQQANVSTILRALCLDLEEQHRRNLITLAADFVDTAPSRLVDDLSRGSMPVVGLVSESGTGHAVVVTGLTYSWTKSGKQVRKARAEQRRLAEAEKTRNEVAGWRDALKGRKPKERDDKVAEAAEDLVDVYEAITDAYAIESVTLLDPWSAEEPELTLSGAEFREQLSFVLTREIALELLTMSDDDKRRTLRDEVEDLEGVESLEDVGEELGDALGGLFGGR